MVVETQSHVHDWGSVCKFCRPLKCLANGSRNAQDSQVWLLLCNITAPDNPGTLHLYLACSWKGHPQLTSLHAMRRSQKVAAPVNGRSRPMPRVRVVNFEGVCV